MTFTPPDSPQKQTARIDGRVPQVSRLSKPGIPRLPPPQTLRTLGALGVSAVNLSPYARDQLREIAPATRLENVRYAIRDLACIADEVSKQGHKILPLNIGDPLNFDFATPPLRTAANPNRARLRSPRLRSGQAG